MKSGLAFALALLLPSITADPLPLEWPKPKIQRETIAYLGCSLIPVRQTARRPTLEQRLAAPPFLSGEGRVSLDLDALDSAAAKALRAAGPAPLAYHTLVPVAQKLYVERRYFLGKLAHLRKRLALDTDPGWAAVTVDSLITKTKRRMRFHVKDVLDAVLTSAERGGPIVFRPDTWLIAEDLHEDGHVAETHVLGKRADWEWDFAIYDGAGYPRVASPLQPQMMQVPNTCFTCHRSSARLPPFREFPEPSTQGAVLVTLTDREKEIVRKLSGRTLDLAGLLRPGRSDEPLGDYGGLAALHLARMHQSGPLPAWAQPLWERLLKVVPELGN